jgi:hypothetical protein
MAMASRAEIILRSKFRGISKCIYAPYRNDVADAGGPNGGDDPRTVINPSEASEYFRLHPGQAERVEKNVRLLRVTNTRITLTR